MRADRLLSLLMLLQARGRMTAAQLAEKLKVTERTIYRDVEALCAAGVPIYAQAGPSGGYGLLDGYRSRLTGLSDGELEALAMLSVPAPLADLGLSQNLQAALLKVSAALPLERSRTLEHVRERIVVDATRWSRMSESVPHLETLYHAVLENRQVRIGFTGLAGVELTRSVWPLGVVAKAGIWHLVSEYKHRVRVQRIDALVAAETEDRRFDRPADFDLDSFWRDYCEKREARQQLYRVTVSVSPGMLPSLGHMVEQSLPEPVGLSPTSREGWATLELTFPSFWAARGRLLACGSGVRVLAPEPLRVSLIDVAQQIISLYSDKQGD